MAMRRRRSFGDLPALQLACFSNWQCGDGGPAGTYPHCSRPQLAMLRRRSAGSARSAAGKHLQIASSSSAVPAVVHGCTCWPSFNQPRGPPPLADRNRPNFLRGKQGRRHTRGSFSCTVGPVANGRGTRGALLLPYQVMFSCCWKRKGCHTLTVFEAAGCSYGA